MTAIHLINHLPSKTLGDRRTIEILEILYLAVRLRNGLLPRVFGCIRYVHSHNIHSNKLFTKALKCVFFGYSQTQKEYKFHHPTTRKFHITKDATFDEKNFFYQPNNISNSEIAKDQEVMPIPFPQFTTTDNHPHPQPIEGTTPYPDSPPPIPSSIMKEVSNNDPVPLGTFPKYYVIHKKAHEGSL